jgi:hypothetical protein
MKYVLSFLIALGVVLAPLGAFADTGVQTQVVTVAANVAPVLDLEIWGYAQTVIKDPVSGNWYAPGPSTGELPIFASHGTTIQGSFNFGTLQKAYDNAHNDLGIYTPTQALLVDVTASTSGRPYTITQSCNGFTNAAGKKLNSSLLLTTVYSPKDLYNANDPSTAQGPLPSGDVVEQEGQSQFAVGPNPSSPSPVTIFDCSSGLGSIIQCWYGIATGNHQPVTMSSAAGGFTIQGEPSGSQPVTGNTFSGAYTAVITYQLTLK